MDSFEMLAADGQVVIVHLYALCTAMMLAAHLSRKPVFENIAFGVWSGTLIAQLALIAGMVQTGNFTRVGYAYCLSFTLSLLGLAVWRVRHFPFICLVAAPLSMVLSLLALLSGTTALPALPSWSNLFVLIHVATLFVGFVLTAVGFCAGVVFLVSEKHVKSKLRMTDRQKQLPSLNAMDRVNWWATVIGFPCFTVGILGGMVGARMSWGRVLTGDIKELFSILIWLLFAWLFHQRLVVGSRGRKPAVLLIAVFIMCAFSLTFINIFLTNTHNF